MSALPLNIYKKIAVIRLSSDILSYEDIEGNTKYVSVQELGDAIATATPLTVPKIKLDIPVPRIKDVEEYEHDVPANYQIQSSYVRYKKQTPDEWYNTLEYIADIEDELFLQNNTKFGTNIIQQRFQSADDYYNVTVTGSGMNPSAVTARIPKVLSIRMFEYMMDILEKATAFESIVTEQEAQTLFLSKLPQLYQLFPSSSSSSTSNRIANSDNIQSNSSNSINNRFFPNGGYLNPVTVQTVIHDIYTYWVQKRSKLKRPLLRKYWPVTAIDDTNPHYVFRPRTNENKDKYKLRMRKRTSINIETIVSNTYKKLKCIHTDLSNVCNVLHCIVHREQMYNLHVHATIELFHQRLYDIVDTSGLPRKAAYLPNKLSLRKHFQTVPTYYDTQQQQQSSSSEKQQQRDHVVLFQHPTTSNKPNTDASTIVDSTKQSSSREIEPTTFSATPVLTTAVSSSTATTTGGRTIGVEQQHHQQQQRTIPPENIHEILPNIAGMNYGEPAPNFLHPLESRESFCTLYNYEHDTKSSTSYSSTIPYVRTYSNGIVVPTYLYKQRPRIGRGGRVVIDRVPQPPPPLRHLQSRSLRTIQPQPITVFRAGKPLPRYIQPKARLLDLLPRPQFNPHYLRHAIEAISIAAVKQEYYDNATTAGGGAYANHHNPTLTAGGYRHHSSQQQQHVLYPSAGSYSGTGVGGSRSMPPPFSTANSSDVFHSTTNGNFFDQDSTSRASSNAVVDISTGNLMYYNNGLGPSSSSSGGSTVNNHINNYEYDEVIVRVEEYLETDEQLWGEEHYTLGPL